MTEKIQKYQIIKFDSFDFLIILILKKKILHTDRQTDRQTDQQTDRQTDRQTFGLIEATCRPYKKCISVYFGLSQPISDHLGLPRTIWDYI